MSSKLPRDTNPQEIKKPLVKRLKRYISYISMVVSSVIFCILFTSPGNKFIAFTANTFVPGLSITLDEGRFLYQDPFSVTFENQNLNANIENMSIGLNIWQCTYGYLLNKQLYVSIL